MNKTLLIVLATGTLLTTNVWAEVYTGSCAAVGQGNTCSYSLDTATGVLSISGTGAMQNYQYYNSSPLYSMHNSVRSIVIEDGITSVSQYLVYNAANLTSVSIPSSVTSIGNYAFQSAQKLTNINLPNTIQSIGDSAFHGSGLVSIDIPDSVTSIGSHAFGHTKLTEITIPNSVTSIGGYAFQYTNITSLDIPDSVTNLSEDAFAEMKHLQSLAISDTLLSKLKASDLIDSNNYDDALRNLKYTKADIERAKEQGRYESNKDYYDRQLERAEERVLQAKENLLSKSLQVVCKGDVDVCTNALWDSLPQSYKDALGDRFPFNVTTPIRNEKNPDGSYTIKDSMGNIIGYKNKRIYTVEEAAKLSKPTGNTFRLKYK